jgi:pantoate kinase
MKRIIPVLCVAIVCLTVVVLVATCSSNPGIKAGKAFMKNPTLENFMSYTAEVANLDDEQQMELEEWTEENKTELEEAVMSMVKAPEL